MGGISPATGGLILPGGRENKRRGRGRNGCASGVMPKHAFRKMSAICGLEWWLEKDYVRQEQRQGRA